MPVVGRLSRKNLQRFPVNVEIGDIVRGLPLAGGSCQGIYASHVLEHLPLDGFRIALRHTLALLKPGGIFRLVVPDLEIYASRYLSSNDPQAAEQFMRDTFLGVEKADRGIMSFLVTWLGNSRHLWMWDEKGLARELTDAGFVRIRRCSFGDCEDSRFAEVEQADRFVDALAIECRRAS